MAVFEYGSAANCTSTTAHLDVFGCNVLHKAFQD